MTTSILSLALAYAFLLFLVSLAILKSEVAPGLKLVVVPLCLGFYLWHYNALQDYPGWPASTGIPDNFELISSITVEPNPGREDSGGIYIWVRDLESDQRLPRAFRLPYHKQLHRKVDDTLRRQQQGERFIGKPRAGGSVNKPEIEFETIRRDNRSHKSEAEAADG